MSGIFPELIPETSLTNVHPLLKTLFTGKISNLPLVGRQVHSSKNWKNFKTSSFHLFLTEDQDIWSAVKEYMRPFLKVPVQRTSREQVAIFKTGIVNRSIDYGKAGQRGHRKVEYHIIGQFLSNNILVKKKDAGNPRYTNLKALNKPIPY